ncbi:hypothetical protein GQ600_7676 [Phytophthora cactorum]|nr:hypothetical protein GQ600_7676 [Phytophthora cactorum]
MPSLQAKEHGMLGNVFTVYELYAGEETLGTTRDAALHAGDRRLLFACWFADSRRRRYAKGFYSCSRVPQTPRTEEQTQPQEEKVEQQKEQEEQVPVTAAVAPVALESLESPAQLKKLAPSEIESEDDDSEVGGVPSVNKTPATSPSGHSKSLLDVRTRSNTTDGEIQRRQATRPRSTSAAGESRSRRREGEQPQSAETARGHGYDEQYQAQRALAASTRSSSDRVEDALRSDGYWIGDFCVQRRLVRAAATPTAPSRLLFCY